MSISYYSNIKEKLGIDSADNVQHTGTYYNRSNFRFELYAFNQDTKELVILGSITERIARERPQFAREHEDRLWRAFLKHSPYFGHVPLMVDPHLVEEKEESLKEGSFVTSFEAFQASCVKTSQGYTAPVVVGQAQLGKILYNCLGLAGEAGELLEHVKKSLRETPIGLCSQTQTEAVLFELGDVLYYVSELATLMGWSLDYVAEINIVRREKRWLDDAAD